MRTTFLAFVILIVSHTSLFAQRQTAGAQAQDSLYHLLSQMEDWTYKNIDSSRYYACQLMNASIQQKDSFYLASAYTGLAYTYFYRHQLKEALNYLMVSDMLLQKVGDSLDLSDAYMNFGNVYTEMGVYERGIDYYKLAESYIPKDSEWLHYNLAYLYYNTAETFLDLDDYKNTQDYLDKSETHAIKDSAEELLFAIKNMKAELLFINGKYAEARKYAQLALKQASDYNDLIEQAKSLEILAKLQASLGNYEIAFDLQKQALDKAIEFGDPESIAHQYVHSAEIHLNSGKHIEGLNYARKSMNYAQNVKSQILFKETSKVLARGLELNNYPQKALEAYKTHFAYSDTLAKININERLLQNQNKIQSQQAELLSAKNSFQQQIIKQGRYVMLGIGVALVLTLVLILMLLKSLRRKRHTQRVIEEKQKLLNAKSEQLNQTNSTLKQLNEGKDKLFSILTHDLKQPFNQTLQLLEILETQMSDDDLQELTNQVKHSVEETKNTVDHLLTWSKSQFTQLKTEPQSVSLKSITQSLETEFANQISQKGLKSIISIEEELKATVDPNHLEIILRNLIQNAIKFSSSGGVIELKAKRDHGNVLLEVSDHGLGMDKTQLKNLFDVNTHFSTPGTLNEKGTGLGMLIVNDFVRENNGKLEVESEPNKGSTFRIILPAA